MRPMLDDLARNWWLVLLRGICAIIFGVLTIMWPGLSLLTLVLLYGVFALFDGGLAIGAAIMGGAPAPRWWLALVGVLGIAAGAVTLDAYGSVDDFLGEVKRVLRPGGHLLLTDIRGNAGKDLLVSKIVNSGLEIIEEEDITPNVVHAIEEEDAMKWKRIRQSVPKWLQAYFSEFAGSVGSQTHKQLKNRDLVYFRFVLRKQAA